ncbi:uncharacterized protein EV420DRAFT_1645230 [Desarmillaria tabescens]|uniref:Uncharacterized protein n=1 Tax=Armillaria tabescens TaxID=1929756 RepID=A0AA39N1J8_ARMTA|nr:uncharacterized protein EV420DRAFT_1645230 [Desarmillaria tabescens]KAK0454009.1 hypothetical protein EV420DRAFT_1645230 [Desarmillaria tabescens]
MLNCLIVSSQEKDGLEDGLSLYHRTVGLFIESIILYCDSVSVILYIMFVACIQWMHYHLQPVAEMTGDAS